VLALLAAALSPSGAAAQQPSSGEGPRRQLERQQKALSEADRRKIELEAGLAASRAEYERLQAQLLETARLIQASEAQMSAIEARRGELEEQRALVKGTLDARLGSLSALLASMQRMGRNPPPVMITQRADALAMVRSAMMLASAYPELAGQATDLASRLGELDRVTAAISAEGEKLAAETARNKDATLKLASLMETKKRTASEQQVELEKVRKAAAEIARSVSDLNELISRLDKAVTENTRLAEYERQLEAEAARERARAAGAPGRPEIAEVPPAGAEPPAASPEAPAPPVRQAEQRPPAKTPVPPRGQDAASPQVATLAPGGALAMASPGRIQPAIPFHLAKGRLPQPAQGRRAIAFGDKTQTGRSQGIVIETRHNAQVTAPADGWIVYAGEFRSYGQILIINGGGGYHLLLAGLSRIDVQLGQFVLAGEPVGVMASPPKGAPAQSQENAPVLYVELRKDHKPIDPDPWWADPSRKLQG
jgi:septal ring factor EnvC (AmiA/AmiB activator)